MFERRSVMSCVCVWKHMVIVWFFQPCAPLSCVLAPPLVSIFIVSSHPSPVALVMPILFLSYLMSLCLLSWAGSFVFIPVLTCCPWSFFNLSLILLKYFVHAFPLNGFWVSFHLHFKVFLLSAVCILVLFHVSFMTGRLSWTEIF